MTTNIDEPLSLWDPELAPFHVITREGRFNVVGQSLPFAVPGATQYRVMLAVEAGASATEPGVPGPLTTVHAVLDVADARKLAALIIAEADAAEAGERGRSDR